MVEEEAQQRGKRRGKGVDQPAKCSDELRISSMHVKERKGRTHEEEEG